MRGLLEQRCGKCHGELAGSHTKQMVLERSAMVAKQKVVDLKRPEESVLLQRVLDANSWAWIAMASPFCWLR